MFEPRLFSDKFPVLGSAKAKNTPIAESETDISAPSQDNHVLDFILFPLLAIVSSLEVRNAEHDSNISHHLILISKKSTSASNSSNIV